MLKKNLEGVKYDFTNVPELCKTIANESTPV
jgi:hypothetical protein